MDVTGLLVVPVADGEPFALRSGRLATGERVGIAFSTESRLVRVMGAGRRWVYLSEPAMKAMLAPLGIAQVQVDPGLVMPGVSPNPMISPDVLPGAAAILPGISPSPAMNPPQVSPGSAKILPGIPPGLMSGVSFCRSAQRGRPRCAPAPGTPSSFTRVAGRGLPRSYVPCRHCGL